jgi:hypothetical protein
MPKTTRQDETLLCCGCQKTFVFSVAEQIAHAERGYKNKPKRCHRCRRLRTDGSTRSVCDDFSDHDIILEIGKAVGELRIVVERESRDIKDDLKQLRAEIEHLRLGKSSGSRV